MPKVDPGPSTAPKQSASDKVAEMGLASSGIPGPVEARFRDKKFALSKLPPEVRKAYKNGQISEDALRKMVGDC